MCDYLTDSGWMKMLNLNKIELYPIQFANCERLRENDTVYIFDEVGSGKTISSGVMALDYLYRNPKKRVLVVTTNSLTRYFPAFQGGQFKNDWMDKLPFEEMGLKDNITIVNNHYSKFKYPATYGLVIIDEAQLFLNKESLRFKNLISNIRSEKLVFLTATPIKEGIHDLFTYVDIAEKVLGKALSKEWIAGINTTNKEWSNVICTNFDTKSPVTRYFKDTIMALNTQGYKKNQAKRLLPHLWEYDKSINKDAMMIGKINEILSIDNNSRFVIFTRFVEDEAIKIGEYFKNNGYTLFENVNVNTKTYYIVTGKNGDELSKFSRTKNLPTILILTYQVAEQGVNLPGFNYVVNYHISAYPSALEQRFGRIDRMGMYGSVYPEINMCYLISRSYFDSNTSNFYEAISTYIYSLLSYLPSKNMLLSRNIIDQYIQKKSLVNEYVSKIHKLCEDSSEIERIVDYFRKLSDMEKSLETDETLENERQSIIPEIGFGETGDLLEFCLSHEIICDFDNSEEEIKEKLSTEIHAACSELQRHFSLGGNQFSQMEFQNMITTMQDKIFYCKFEWTALSTKDSIDFKNSIGYIDAITECAKFISETPAYDEYSRAFNNCVKIPHLFNQCKHELNKFFEDRFIDNDFNSIFPVLGYKNLLEDVDFGINDKNLLMDNIDLLIKTLPFFKMCSRFRSNLHSLAFCTNGNYRTRYHFNPFTSAMGKLLDSQLEVSDSFKDKYFNDYVPYSGYFRFFIKFFCIKLNSDNVVIASNWYKLAYHYTRKEEFSWGRFDEYSNFVRIENKYKMLEILFLKIADLKYNYKKTSANEKSLSEAVDLNSRQADMLKQELKKIKRCDSLFHDFIFTEFGNERKWLNICRKNIKIYYYGHQVYKNDYWTQGIYEELFDCNYSNCFWEQYI